MLKLSFHALERASERANFTISQAQESFTPGLTVEINPPSFEQESEAYRLFFQQETELFYVGVCVYDLVNGIPKPHTIKTILTLEMFETRQWEIEDEIKQKAVHRVLGNRPIAYHAWMQKNSLIEKMKRRFEVVSPWRTKYNVKLTRKHACHDFYQQSSVLDIFSHPGILSQLHAECEKHGFRLEERMQLKYFPGSIVDGHFKPTKQPSSSCQYCGQAPLPTDLSITEKIDNEERARRGYEALKPRRKPKSL